MVLRDEINKLNMLLLAKYGSKIVHASLTRDKRKLVSLEIVYKKRVFRSTIRYSVSKKYCMDHLCRSILLYIEKFEENPKHSDRLRFIGLNSNNLCYSKLPDTIELLEYRPHGEDYQESLLPTHIVKRATQIKEKTKPIIQTQPKENVKSKENTKPKKRTKLVTK